MDPEWALLNQLYDCVKRPIFGFLGGIDFP